MPHGHDPAARPREAPLMRAGVLLCSGLLAILSACGGTAIAAQPAPSAPPARGMITVRIETTLGSIEVEVDSARAPVTATNFLRYVDAGAYIDGRFHRTVTADNQPRDSVRIAVIQGGTTRRDVRFPAIPLERTRETGLKHLDGTISMARGGPDTAQSDFFLCVGDQPSLDFGGTRNPDGQGFAAFGRVVRGMDVVRAIHRAPANGQSLAPPVAITGIARLRR